MRKSTHCYDLKNGFGINCYQELNPVTNIETCRIEAVLKTPLWEEVVEYYCIQDKAEANKCFKDLYNKYSMLGRR